MNSKKKNGPTSLKSNFGGNKLWFENAWYGGVKRASWKPNSLTASSVQHLLKIHFFEKGISFGQMDGCYDMVLFHYLSLNRKGKSKII